MGKASVFHPIYAVKEGFSEVEAFEQRPERSTRAQSLPGTLRGRVFQTEQQAERPRGRSVAGGPMAGER